MLAVLDLWDFTAIWIIVTCFAGGSFVYSYIRPTDVRTRRIEAKVDMILRHLGLEFSRPASAGLSAEVQALADDPTKKIQAIALHRQQTGLGLKDAKDAVEAYMGGGS